MALMNGDSLWWFDMWGGFYQYDEVYDALQKSRQIYAENIADHGSSVEEILLVMDPENMLLINDMNDRSGTFHNIPRFELGKCGLPYEVCSFNDLKKMDTTQYRFVILAHPFQLPPEKMTVLKEKLLNSNRTILWVYGTVINDEGKWDPDNVEKVCGIPYASAEIPVKDMGNWKSAYVYRTDKEITSDVLRKMALNAGCHPWINKARPVLVNSRFVCLHTAKAEKLTVTLPRTADVVTELYTGKIWQNTNKIELESTDVQTWFLKIGK